MTANGSKPESSVVTTNQTSCDELLQKFWELEEVPKMNNLTVAEKQCEQQFEENFKRHTDGKFEVKLPFKDERNKLDWNIMNFLKKYLEMGHMELINNNSFMNSGYYLPHHCVLWPESTTTKLRVAFDASCKTTTNVSLNDILHTGPRLQEGLFNILLRFRKHRYVFSADIEKMYRQIRISEADRKYQIIFWRWNPDETIKTYAFKTVTYGTASAPYLAVKCLQKIADNILMEFGMPLRKWCTNEKVLLQGIDPSYIENDLNIEKILTIY
ncbi:uncharacterized protein LOC124420211 [Lucilia cuprina]|uniref:uncharacterized protein LOC124420211 n=1 Tax=Lucilia cuprina TaxID=7375 RepID=UPI001F0607E0|nr:uncharacterized protein LOC124420211 [Lucilia cuprina]